MDPSESSSNRVDERASSQGLCACRASSECLSPLVRQYTRVPCLISVLDQYGNEASLNYHFSAASILVVVPPSDYRILAPAPYPESPRGDTDGGGGSTTKSPALSTPADSVGAEGSLVDAFSFGNMSASNTGDKLTPMSGSPRSAGGFVW